ncbi:MAG: glycosyltransferase family 39 protein [Bryobacteraceae bacterium]
MPVLLFLGVYLFSGLSPVGTSFDSRWTVYIAMSLWNHHDTNLDEYSLAIRENNYYAVECVDGAGHVRIGPPEQCDGHWYNSYPVGDAVLAAPLIWAAVGILTLAKPALAHLPVSQPMIAAFLRGDYDAGHAVIEMEAASFMLAAAAVVMFAIARRYLSTTRSVMLALLFAIATSAYSVGGRAIWQHTPSMLLLAITIYLLLRAEEEPRFVAWAGLPVALAYTARPTDSLFVLIFTVYVAVRHRAYLTRYLLIAAPVAAVFVAYNYSVYHAILSPYYRPHLEGFLPANWGRMEVALAGNLVSPGRGLLIYTPVFGFAIWSMLRAKWTTPLSKWLAVLVLMHWVVVSSYVVNWWAGHSYGPRFFTDVTPVFVLFLIPYFARWDALSGWLRTAFVALALVGLAMHLRGGWSPAVYQWNVRPVNIDQHPERNWDWTDPPFLR